MTELTPRDLPCYLRQSDFVFNTTKDGTAAYRHRKIAVAVALCAMRPLKQRCLDVELGRMLEGARTFGVYGGTTQAERGRMLGVNARPIVHGTRWGYMAEVKRKVPTCARCRAAVALYKREREAS